MQQPSTPPAGAVQRPLGVTILVILAAFRGVVGLWASIAVVGVLNSLGAGDFAILNLIWLAIAVVFLVLAFGAWKLKTWAWTLGIGLTVGSILLEAYGMLTEGPATRRDARQHDDLGSHTSFPVPAGREGGLQVPLNRQARSAPDGACWMWRY
jgi:hypothetical protein